MFKLDTFFSRLLLPAVLVAGLPLASGAQTTTTRSAGRPHVIMILTDDMGYADISAFAQKPLKVKTPNIDRLAREGTKLTQFYVSMPICSPSRAAILSGMHAPETQLTTFLQTRKGNADADQNDFMDPALAYLPRSFKTGGYATAHVGKWHLGGGRDVRNAPSIARYGYDEFWSTWESPSPIRSWAPAFHPGIRTSPPLSWSGGRQPRTWWTARLIS